LSQPNEVNQAPEAAAEPPAGDPFDVALAEGLDRALRPRRDNVVPVDVPLALICQAQRSGGTLLARLFDGHPQCHAHPYEFQIGHPKPHIWPRLAVDEDPETWFAKLQESYLTTLFVKGRRRIPLKAPGDKTKASYPFILPPAFQRLLFLEEVARRSPIESERGILDCYMTSLFNAWLDNENLRGDKRWVVAFSPRRAWGDGLQKFFELYPDGRLISILRDPLSWYTSAQGRDPAADVSVLLELWKRSAREMVAAARGYEDRTRIVRFDRLLLDTPGTMRELAGYLGIDFDPQLAVPTFNRYPVGANSSYGLSGVGVVTDPVERHTTLLDEEQQALIRSECEGLYHEALEIADRQATPARPGGLRRLWGGGRSKDRGG
jgi:Sulfotransferase family